MSDVQGIKDFQQSYESFRQEIAKAIVGQDAVIKMY